jgi:hypothetical protein
MELGYIEDKERRRFWNAPTLKSQHDTQQRTETVGSFPKVVVVMNQ